MQRTGETSACSESASASSIPSWPETSRALAGPIDGQAGELAMAVEQVRERPPRDVEDSDARIICRDLTKIYTGAPPMAPGR